MSLLREFPLADEYIHLRSMSVFCCAGSPKGTQEAGVS